MNCVLAVSQLLLVSSHTHKSFATIYFINQVYMLSWATKLFICCMPAWLQAWRYCETSVCWKAMKHENFVVIQCGLILDPEFPFIGATPDGLVDCKCCNTGVLEIKCSFSCKQRFRWSCYWKSIIFPEWWQWTTTHTEGRPCLLLLGTVTNVVMPSAILWLCSMARRWWYIPPKDIFAF